MVLWVMGRGRVAFVYVLEPSLALGGGGTTPTST